MWVTKTFLFFLLSQRREGISVLTSVTQHARTTHNPPGKNMKTFFFFSPPILLCFKFFNKQGVSAMETLCTWSKTWSRSQSIRHDAPAACLRTWTFGDRWRACAEPLCPPRLRAASRRWRRPAWRSRAARPATCPHTQLQANLRRKHKTAAAEAASPLRGSEWRCCRNLSSDWLLSAKAPPTNIHLITRIHSCFIGWCKNKMFFFYFLLYIIVTSRTTTKKSVTFHGSEHMDKSTISCLK